MEIKIGTWGWAKALGGVKSTGLADGWLKEEGGAWADPQVPGLECGCGSPPLEREMQLEGDRELDDGSGGAGQAGCQGNRETSMPPRLIQRDKQVVLGRVCQLNRRNGEGGQ